MHLSISCDYISSLNSCNRVQIELHAARLLNQMSYSALFSHPQYPSCLLPTHISSRADTAKMTQPMRGDQAHPPAPARKSTSLSSPSAARRLYRNLSGKFRTNPPGLEDSVVSGRGADKERLRKTTIVSQTDKTFKPRLVVSENTSIWIVGEKHPAIY